jgi:hypothetical protein
MLNEFSDRAPKDPPRPFLLRGELWLGVFTVLIITALVLGFML